MDSGFRWTSKIVPRAFSGSRFAASRNGRAGSKIQRVIDTQAGVPADFLRDRTREVVDRQRMARFAPELRSPVR